MTTIIKYRLINVNLTAMLRNMKITETSYPIPALETSHSKNALKFTDHQNSHGFGSPLVHFEDVTKSYDGSTPVVKALNLQVKSGEFLTLLGPSGSGKTTTLMMLAGFESVTSGAISLQGRLLNDVPPHKRDMGVVFQSYALFPHMTVAQNVAFPLVMRKLGAADISSKVERALHLVKLNGLAHRRPPQLSGGQQQRVALARALVFSPKLVLMDEPMGALDRQLREHMQLELKRMHEDLGLTVVYVTHDQDEALVMSDRIAVFNRGEVEQIDLPRALYDRPQTAFVAAFIGENNLLKGTLTNQDGHQALVTLDAGHSVRTRAREDLAVGMRVAVCVRPEAIGPHVQDGVNRVTGELIETIYRGNHSRLVMRIADGTDLLVNAPPQSAASLRLKDRIEAIWPTEASWLVQLPSE